MKDRIIHRHREDIAVEDRDCPIHGVTPHLIYMYIEEHFIKGLHLHPFYRNSVDGEGIRSNSCLLCNPRMTPRLPRSAESKPKHRPRNDTLGRRLFEHPKG